MRVISLKVLVSVVDKGLIKKGLLGIRPLRMGTLLAGGERGAWPKVPVIFVCFFFCCCCCCCRRRRCVYFACCAVCIALSVKTFREENIQKFTLFTRRSRANIHQHSRQSRKCRALLQVPCSAKASGMCAINFFRRFSPFFFFSLLSLSLSLSLLSTPPPRLSSVRKTALAASQRRLCQVETTEANVPFRCV